jgi:hypothetical protein
MYSMRNTTVGYHYPQGTTTYTIQPVQQANHRPTTNHTHSMSHTRVSSIPINSSTRHVNPALTIDASRISRTFHPVSHPSNYNSRREPHARAEIDDSPIIDPRAFQYLNPNERQSKKNKKNNSNDMDSGIDYRPIINLDAVMQLERRRQQQIEKNNRLRGDDGSNAGIDDRSIVDINAFRFIEAKTSKKQGQNDSSGIDDRPITNPDAFKYVIDVLDLIQLFSSMIDDIHCCLSLLLSADI